MTQLALFFLLATLVEGIVAYAGDKVPTAIKQYVAALVAIALCVAYNADLLAVLGLTAPYPYVGGDCDRPHSRPRLQRAARLHRCARATETA